MIMYDIIGALKLRRTMIIVKINDLYPMINRTTTNIMVVEI